MEYSLSFFLLYFFSICFFYTNQVPNSKKLQKKYWKELYFLLLGTGMLEWYITEKKGKERWVCSCPKIFFVSEIFFVLSFVLSFESILVATIKFFFFYMYKILHIYIFIFHGIHSLFYFFFFLWRTTKPFGAINFIGMKNVDTLWCVCFCLCLFVCVCLVVCVVSFCVVLCFLVFLCLLCCFCVLVVVCLCCLLWCLRDN